MNEELFKYIKLEFNGIRFKVVTKHLGNSLNGIEKTTGFPDVDLEPYNFEEAVGECRKVEKWFAENTPARTKKRK